MPRSALLVFATGKDRPGIVDRIAGLVFESGANLEDSRMAILGGEFALIVLVTGGVEDLGRLKRGIPELASELELTAHFKDTVAGPEARKGTRPSMPYRIHAVAMDHPGIVHKVTHVLAQNDVNVARLDTSLSNAPTTGTPVFSLRIEVEVPTSVPIAKLRGQLQQVAESENIDLELRPAE